MPPAINFALFCFGISVCVVSAAYAFKLVMSVFHSSKHTSEHPQKRWEPMTNPGPDGLAERLHAFQTLRYASPIVRRRLDNDAGPRPPSQRPLPPPIPIRRPSMSVQPPKDPNDDKVVPLPVKMKKEPKKED